QLQPQGPYQLGGWSAGGLIAYEMAQQLQQQGHAVSFLALIDSNLPEYRREDITEEEIGLGDIALTRFVVRIYHITLPVEIAEQGNPLEQFTWACEQLKRLDIIPRDFDLEQVRVLVRSIKTIMTAVQTYTPQPYAGRMTLFR